jgi:hypothetical protein
MSTFLASERTRQAHFKQTEGHFSSAAKIDGVYGAGVGTLTMLPADLTEPNRPSEGHCGLAKSREGC